MTNCAINIPIRPVGINIEVRGPKRIKKRSGKPISVRGLGVRGNRPPGKV